MNNEINEIRVHENFSNWKDIKKLLKEKVSIVSIKGTISMKLNTKKGGVINVYPGDTVGCKDGECYIIMEV